MTAILSRPQGVNSIVLCWIGVYLGKTAPQYFTLWLYFIRSGIFNWSFRLNDAFFLNIQTRWTFLIFAKRDTLGVPNYGRLWMLHFTCICMNFTVNIHSLHDCKITTTKLISKFADKKCDNKTFKMIWMMPPQLAIWIWHNPCSKSFSVFKFPSFKYQLH